MSNQSLTSKEAYLNLCHRILGYDHHYYAYGNSLISDAEYDALVKTVEATEQAHPDWVFAGSPTQKVGSGFMSGLSTAAHNFPMLSLAKVFDPAELVNKAKAILTAGKLLEHPIDPTFSVQLKLDGLAVSLWYHDGQLVKALTRGDGMIGEDVTNNVMVMCNVPKVIPEKNPVEVRGEVLSPLIAFHRMNERLRAEGKETYANPRNYAVGSLKLQSSAESRKRHLRFVAYYAVTTEIMRSYDDQLRVLSSYGFELTQTVPCKLFNLMDVVTAIGHSRATADYATDGAVVKLWNSEAADRLGHNNRELLWAFAFKFEPTKATSRLVDVHYQIGRTGVITPVAEIVPVDLDGSIVSRASLHNADIIREKDIRIGDTVVLHKAGEIIPQILEVLLDERPAGAVPLEFPSYCPECNTRLVHPKRVDSEESKFWVCPNITCKGRCVETLLHWCSKDTMDIEDFGDAAIVMLTKHKVQQFADLYRLTVDDLMRTIKCSAQEGDRLIGIIQRSKSAPFEKVLAGLGIPQVGRTVSAKFSWHFQNVHEFFRVARNNFKALTDLKIMNKAASLSLQAWLDDPATESLLSNLEQVGVYGHSANYGQKKEDGPLSGKVFVFTGELGCDRDQAIADVTALGGRAASAVSKKTTYLVAGNACGATKLEAAKKNGTTVLSEAEFVELMKKAQAAQ